MANATNQPAKVPPGRSAAGDTTDYDPPPSLPLEIFLFCAFLVTVAAYLAGQRSDQAAEQLAARFRNEKLDRQVVDKSKYLSYAKLGFRAQEQKDFAGAVSNFQCAVRLQNTGEAHYNLGNALLLLSRTNDALKEFQAALALDPKLKDSVRRGGKP